MFLYLSKLLPLFLYPLGLACVSLIAALILWRWRRWSVWAVVLALLVLWLGGNRLVSMRLLQTLEWRHAPLMVDANAADAKADVIVVLGGGTRGHAAPRQHPEVNEAGDRLIHALYLYKQGVAPKVLVSGGVVAFAETDRATEAENMAELLILMGVPAEDILLEKQSRNTFENAVYTLAMLEEFELDEIALVTSALHMPRSVAIFEKQGANLLPAPADYLVTEADWDYYLSPSLRVQIGNLLPDVTNLGLTTHALKEYIGFLVYRLRGWV